MSKETSWELLDTMQENKRNAYLILSNIAWGVIDNAADALLGEAPGHRGLAHKQLTCPMFFLTRRADLWYILQSCWAFLNIASKTRRQGKGP